ncbi:MAG TPA: M23 family metallopeptidase [Gaiellaceae bacterium]|nr:M23 family metallopeptidase [Gaiellaceae bacterium]
MRPALALPLLLALIAAVATTSAGGEARTPTAAAGALAIKLIVPNTAAVSTQAVNVPPATSPATTDAYKYPSDGSIISAASTTASATATVTTNAAAAAESDVTQLSLFGGELTATAVTARTSAGTGYSGAGGNANGSAVQNLVVDGQPVTATQTQTPIPVGGWGQLSLDAETVDRTAPLGSSGYRVEVIELDLKLVAAHGGLPAGSELQIGYAKSAVQTAPPAAPPVTTTAPVTTPLDPTAGDAPQLLPKPGTAKSSLPQPLYHVHPKLKAGPYIFPVYGPSSYIDTFGAERSDVSGDFHHGDDIFGQLGQPLVAVTNGIVFSVGYEKIGGNRLWILDSQGNQYYYAHLSAYSTAIHNGSHVKAGEVVGFMGNTGDAEGTPYHLHFEVHPVSYLYLGYDGAVDPTPYLNSWKHETTLPFPIPGGWVPAVPGATAAPEPGAILLGESDISTASGLDPSSLQAALKPVAAATLRQALVPVVSTAAKAPRAPKTYPGRG